MPPLPEAIILVLAPFALLFSYRVWHHAQTLLLGAMLTPGSRTVTGALRVMGLDLEHHFTNYHRVLNRATWSARQGSQILLGLLITLRVPPGATLVFGADDTVERRSGRKITAKAIARTTPVLLGLFSLVTLLVLQLSQSEPIPVPVTAWYRKAEPTFADCLALVRQHLWRARSLVHSTPAAECVQFPREALDLLIHGVPLAA